MSTNNTGEVDMEIDSESSTSLNQDLVSQSFPTPPPINQTLQVDLPEETLAEFKQAMLVMRSFQIKAKDMSDPRYVGQWRSWLHTFVGSFATIIESTDLARKLVPLDKAEVKSLDGEKLEEWRVAAEKAMDKGDFADVIGLLKIQKVNNRRQLRYTHDSPNRVRDWIKCSIGNIKEMQSKGLSTTLGFTAKNTIRRCISGAASLVQSSCIGKSRLVQELGKQILTLSVCFRKDNRPTSGWPPRDEPACFFFFDNKKYTGEELAAAFLGALMDVVADKLEARNPSTSMFLSWMKDWELDEPVELAKSSRYWCFVEVARRATESLEQGKLGERRKSVKGETTAFAWYDQLYHDLCLPSAKRLMQLLNTLPLQQPYFLIAFDECSALGFPTAEELWKPVLGKSLIGLRRIIKAGDAHHVDCKTNLWHLILDTDPSIFELDLSDPAGTTTSGRLMGNYRMLPPWHCLGFNQMVSERHAQAIKTPADVLTLNHQKPYGRPYWFYLSDRELMDSAYHKLFCDSKFYLDDPHHVFAAFAVRICLELGGTEASARMAVEAVRSHMRLFLGLLDSFVMTASPAEPILAIAAAKALNRSPATYQTAVETLLNQLVTHGLAFDLGLQGELYNRLLFTIARDKATLTEHKSSIDYAEITDGWKVYPVRLSSFLETLLGENFGVGNSQKSMGKELRNDTSNIWLNFTHFVQLKQNVDEVKPSMLLKAWSSCSAIQCAPNQPVIDGFIVAYRGDLEKDFNIDKLIMIPWQTKTRVGAASKTLSEALTGPCLVDMGTDGRQVRRKAEVLVLFIDLSTSAKFAKTKSRARLELAKVVDGKKTWLGNAQDGEDWPERYCLNIRGHDKTTYPVMQGFEEQFELLSRRSLSRNTGTFPGLAISEREMEADMQILE